MQLPLVTDEDGPALLVACPGGVIGKARLLNEGIDECDAEPTAFAAVNLDPCAVFFGLELERVEAEVRMAANARLAPRGRAFGVLPPGELSGYPKAAPVLRRHRMRVPELEVIELSAIFAVSTVRTTIEEAERSYRCFGDLYKQAGRQMPDEAQIKDCFRGLQNEKARVFGEVSQYASTVRDVISHGYQDRELRSVLALETKLPRGLGLAKLSFTLALLGHDTICLDARLLGRIFPDKERRGRFERVIGKSEEGTVTDHALLEYEAVEDAFLAGNPHYDPRDPVGRARAQWQSWEAVGGRGASHSVWLEMVS